MEQNELKIVCLTFVNVTLNINFKTLEKHTLNPPNWECDNDYIYTFFSLWTRSLAWNLDKTYLVFAGYHEPHHEAWELTKEDNRLHCKFTYIKTRQRPLALFETRIRLVIILQKLGIFFVLFFCKNQEVNC